MADTTRPAASQIAGGTEIGAIVTEAVASPAALVTGHKFSTTGDEFGRRLRISQPRFHRHGRDHSLDVGRLPGVVILEIALDETHHLAILVGRVAKVGRPSHLIRIE